MKSINNSNCILLVCNKGFLDYAMFIANQLSKQMKNYDVVICSSENIKRQINEKLPVSFLHIETTSFTDNLPTIDRLGKYAYWRIPAIENLSKKYRKILYLDTDIFVNTVDIEKIFEIDLDNYILAAVRDVHQITKPNRIPHECKALKKPWFPYFNSGVLLINSRQWIQQNCFEKIKGLCTNSTHALVCHDQSLLNLMCDGKWLELSPVWNWQYSYKNCFLTEYVSPKFIHFAGAKKLWHDADGTIPKKYWEIYQQYKSKTIEDSNFPDWNTDIFKDLGKRLLKNVFYFNAYKKYIAQFPKSTSIINHK